MPTFTIARERSTTIYIILSTCLFFAGIAATLWGGIDIPAPTDSSGKLAPMVQRSPIGFAIGTSLIAASLMSLGFAVLRRYDDADSTELFNQLNKNENETRQLRTTLRKARLTIPNPSERCLFDPAISDRFKQAIQDCPPNSDIQVDVVGLKLSRFLKDQLEHLEATSKNRSVCVRMLIQDPASPNFDAICKMENRDVEATKNDIRKTISHLNGASQDGNDLSYTKANLKVLLRFYSNYQPIAFFKVGDTILVRPRIRSTGAGSRFYEEYEKNEGAAYFGLYKEHFDECWNEAAYKQLSD